MKDATVRRRHPGALSEPGTQMMGCDSEFPDPPRRNRSPGSRIFASLRFARDDEKGQVWLSNQANFLRRSLIGRDSTAWGDSG
jgi:hypothetical protein